tara:strand:- start:412 stop:798 length:387 start_codon:yes stop_codon:yes gene_type:complete
MKNDKNVSLISGIVMLISCFLPYVKMGVFQISIFDVVSNDITTEATLLPLLSIGAIIFAYLNRGIIARICSSGVLLILLYAIFKVYDAQSGLGTFGVEINFFSLVGVGAYVMLISSVLSIIFSKATIE